MDKKELAAWGIKMVSVIMATVAAFLADELPITLLAGAFVWYAASNDMRS